MIFGYLEWFLESFTLELLVYLEVSLNSFEKVIMIFIQMFTDRLHWDFFNFKKIRFELTSVPFQ